MNNLNNLNKRKEVITSILDIYTNLSLKQVEELITATNNIDGVSFVSVNGYSSDKSNNTEISNQVVNIGASYKNMLTKDSDIYANFDISKVDVDKFNYATIDTKDLTLDEYKKAVKEALPIALEELNRPKKKKDTSNDIWLNKALVFNINTMRLGVFGQGINKVVKKQGTFKVVKSAPKTIAKRLIERQAKGKAQKLRRFAIDNLVGSVKVSGEVVEIG